MPRRLAVLLLLAALIAGCDVADIESDDSGGGGAENEGEVVRVVDGDTIHVMVGGVREKVRYIGVDTPETVHPRKGVECFGKRASAYNGRLVDGERVRLVTDVEQRDRYGRLLAYVYRVRDGRFVNAALAREGYALALTIPPNVRFADRFARLTREARDADRGLWSAC